MDDEISPCKQFPLFMYTHLEKLFHSIYLKGVLASRTSCSKWGDVLSQRMREGNEMGTMEHVYIKQQTCFTGEVLKKLDSRSGTHRCSCTEILKHPYDYLLKFDETN